MVKGMRLRVREAPIRLWPMSRFSKFVVIAAAVAGCKGKAAPTTPKNEVGMEVPKVDPTLCDTAGKNVVTYDLNKDNKPDVWRLYKTEDEGGESGRKHPHQTKS